MKIMPKKTVLKQLMPLLLLCLAACAGKAPLQPQAVMDNPRHLCFTGMQLLEKQQPQQARQQFERAIAFDSRYSAAYSGRALVELSEKNIEAAEKDARKAMKFAEADEQEVLARMCQMQVLYEKRSGNWLKALEKQVKAIEKITVSEPAVYLFMGNVYKNELRFDAADDMFKKVLDLDMGFVAEADEQWKLTQKIVRAAPGSRIGKEMALVDKVTRADISALLVEEMLIERMYQIKEGKRYQAGFKTAGEGSADENVEDTMLPEDVREHPLREDVRIVLDLHIRGLEPLNENTFAPDEPVTRGEFSLVVEDILVKIKEEQMLSREFIGNNSPFPDVRKNHYAFNAIMVCTTRGFLEADTDGAFGVSRPVSGADALLTLRRLREELKDVQVSYAEPQTMYSQRSYLPVNKDPVALALLKIMVSAGLFMLQAA